MILIADSGSTKTDWRLVDRKGSIQQFKTSGFNPYFQTTEEIITILAKELIPLWQTGESKDELKIYYYGAGCSSPDKCEIVSKAIKHHCPDANIEVDHDLLAAARALCGTEPGIAAILGTGSNSCYYDGKNIVENFPNLGFMLGDEGSGGYMGKQLIIAYLYNELPPDLHRSFKDKYKMGREEILDNIYKKPLPNKFCASFGIFLQENIQHPFVVRLISDSFSLFFQKHICKYPQHTHVPFSCVGSIGYYFANILREIATDKGVTVGKIIESPIAALTLYHIENQHRKS